MRKLIALVAALLLAMPAASLAQGGTLLELIECEAPFVITIDSDGGYLCSLALDGVDFPPGGGRAPCTYSERLGLEVVAACPPTVGGGPLVPPRPPLPGPCSLGMCPPSVGLGGTFDPFTDEPLIDVLPGFEGLNIAID